MVHGRQNAGFSLEARQAFRIPRDLREQHLDRDVAIELLVAGEIDLAHAARANALNDNVRPDPGTALQPLAGTWRVIHVGMVWRPILTFSLADLWGNIGGP
jgi:hypothetical protein